MLPCGMSLLIVLVGCSQLCLFMQVSMLSLKLSWCLSGCSSAGHGSSMNPGRSVFELVHYTKCSPTFTVIKGKFLCRAVSIPRSKRFTLYFPDRPVHSDTISASLGSIQPYATINARRVLIHISTTVYSQVLVSTAE